MDQAYAYEEDDVEEGITFKKIGHFLAKAWLRMVIYAVILAAVATVVFVPIKVFFKSEPVAQTSIEFIYRGIEKGESPDGGTLDTNEIISTTVLSAAVEQSNLQSKISDITTLRNAMRVEGVLTDEYIRLTEAAANGDQTAVNTLRTYNMIPTRFNIVISDPDKLGLSDAQAVLLLNNVVEQYYTEFQRKYSVISMFDSAMYTLSSNEMLEFADMYDMYVSSLNSVQTYLSDLAATAPTFTSHKNNTTFNVLLSELTILDSNYDLYNAFITANNVWRNTAVAKRSLEASQKTATNELAATESYIESLQAQINAIKYDFEKKPEYDAPSGGQILVNYPDYPPVYNTLNSQLDAAKREVREYKVKLSNIATRLEQIEAGGETTDENKAAALSTIQALEKQSSNLVVKVNATIQDYFDTTFISSSVRKVQQPVVTRRGINLSLLVVYGVAVLAGVIIAGIVTAVKISRNNAAKAKAEAAQAESEKTADKE